MCYCCGFMKQSQGLKKCRTRDREPEEGVCVSPQRSDWPAQWRSLEVVPMLATLFCAPGTLNKTFCSSWWGGRGRKRVMQRTRYTTYILRKKGGKKAIQFQPLVDTNYSGLRSRMFYFTGWCFLACCRVDPYYSPLDLHAMCCLAIACIPAPLFLQRPQFICTHTHPSLSTACVLLPLSSATAGII